MKRILMLTFLSINSSQLYAAKPIIPAQFHGTWAEDPIKCDIRSDFDTILEINDKNVFHPGWEEGCEIYSIKKTSKTELSGKFSCNSMEEKVGKNITLTLTKDGKLHEDKSPGLSRCKK